MKHHRLLAGAAALALLLALAWLLGPSLAPPPTTLVAAPPSPSPTAAVTPTFAAGLPVVMATPQLPPAIATRTAGLGTQIANAQATALANPPASVGHLLNLETGAVHRLWGERETGQGMFAGGGRWLAYAAGPDPQAQRMAVVDLSALPPVIQDFGSGVQPLVSPGGAFLAYSTGWYGDSGSRVVVKDTATGITVATFDGRGFNWSPDGRWFTFQGPWEGEGVPIRMYLADAATWTARLAYQMLPCSCDSTFGPYWSPDARWMAYGRKVEGDGYAVDPVSLTGPRLPTIPMGWASADEVRVGGGAHALRFNVTTGVSTLDPQASAPGELTSPDGEVTVRRGSVQFLTITSSGISAVDRAGTLLWEAPGSPIGWSPDGQFFVVSPLQTQAGQAQSVELRRRLDGGVALTMPGAAAPTWSPDGTRFLYAVSQGRQGCTGPIGSHRLLVHLVDMAAGTDRPLSPAFELDCRQGSPYFIWAPDERHVLLCGSCGIW